MRFYVSFKMDVMYKGSNVHNCEMFLSDLIIIRWVSK